VEFNQLCHLIQDTLQLNTIILDKNTKLLGHLPEFDSLSLLTILTKLEKDHNISIEQEELTGDIFRTVGDLWEYVKQKDIGT